jgi:hypothetical protein
MFRNYTVPFRTSTSDDVRNPRSSRSPNMAEEVVRIPILPSGWIRWTAKYKVRCQQACE